MGRTRTKPVVVKRTELRVLAATVMGTMVVSISASRAQANQTTVQKKKPTKLVECIPGPAYKLFQWPDESVLNGPKRVAADAAEVAAAKWQCLDWWMKDVLATSWLPPAEMQPIFIRGEFDGRDVVRMAWERNGYRIQMSQTASAFTIKLTPRNGQATGADAAGTTEYARDLCARVFPQVGWRWGGAGPGEADVRVPIQDLSRKIASWSFEPALCRYLDDDQAMWGRAPTQHEASVPSPREEAAIRRERDPNNAEWERSSVSYNYWFRMVNWWNDGRSVGFYFLKVAEGAWVASWACEIDHNFFHIVRPHHKEPTGPTTATAPAPAGG